MRGSEISNIKWEDVKLYEEDTFPYISLCIQFSKTDQAGVGVFRSLYANHSFLCPFSCWERYTVLCDFRGMCGRNRAFPASIIKMVRATIKWIVEALGLESSFFSAHSLRAGGASTLYANRIDLDTIRRFGRWRSSTFHIYLYGDSLNLRNLSAALCKENNLMGQIRTTNDSRVTQGNRPVAMETNTLAVKETRPIFRHRVGGYEEHDAVVTEGSTGSNEALRVMSSMTPVLSYDYPMSARDDLFPQGADLDVPSETWTSKETVCMSSDGLCRKTTRKDVRLVRRQRENICPNSEVGGSDRGDFFLEVKEVTKEEKFEIEPILIPQVKRKKEEEYKMDKKEFPTVPDFVRVKRESVVKVSGQAVKTRLE